MLRKRDHGALTSADLKPILQRLRATNQSIARAFPGDAGERQPVHTVYGGAHLFKADSAPKLGALAIAALDEYAADDETFARAFVPGNDRALATTVRSRVIEKLRREPVEDFRIDFEDGYGNRSDDEEDSHARSAAEQVALGLRSKTLPPFIGIRIKPLSRELHSRSLRTLDLFVTTLARTRGARIPPNFVVTIPKVMAPGHVSAVARACAALERRLRLTPGVLRLELMIETPQSILAPDGSSALRGLVVAGDGRVSGVHFGTYDYTALCG
ncbi:MAG: phosphoenolpyruvate kinase, partial [Acidobacteria bacterium]|nr:phosphoenolpyruvate kinase [Acidobacteriota bacterium]MCA1651543.1 phosphoenolpyruvate kinase [Acidobacteriota bacterium]